MGTIVLMGTEIKPDSATIDFWNEWKKDKQEKGIKEALEDLRRQSKSK